MGECVNVSNTLLSKGTPNATLPNRSAVDSFRRRGAMCCVNGHGVAPLGVTEASTVPKAASVTTTTTTTTNRSTPVIKGTVKGSPRSVQEFIQQVHQSPKERVPFLIMLPKKGAQPLAAAMCTLASNDTFWQQQSYKNSKVLLFTVVLELII